jgi:hypothetical protein
LRDSVDRPHFFFVSVHSFDLNFFSFLEQSFIQGGIRSRRMARHIESIQKIHQRTAQTATTSPYIAVPDADRNQPRISAAQGVVNGFSRSQLSPTSPVASEYLFTMLMWLDMLSFKRESCFNLQISWFLTSGSNIDGYRPAQSQFSQSQFQATQSHMFTNNVSQLSQQSQLSMPPSPSQHSLSSVGSPAHPQGQPDSTTHIDDLSSGKRKRLVIEVYYISPP